MSNWWADRLTKEGGQTGQDLPRTPVPSGRAPSNPSPPVRSRPVRVEENCPSCYSGNYMSAPGSNYKRCYDCGYPVVQSGTGVSGTSRDGAAKPATQVGGGGFNPKVIIGRVD